MFGAEDSSWEVCEDKSVFEDAQGLVSARALMQKTTRSNPGDDSSFELCEDELSCGLAFHSDCIAIVLHFLQGLHNLR